MGFWWVGWLVGIESACRLGGRMIESACRRGRSAAGGLRRVVVGWGGGRWSNGSGFALGRSRGRAGKMPAVPGVGRWVGAGGVGCWWLVVQRERLCAWAQPGGAGKMPAVPGVGRWVGEGGWRVGGWWSDGSGFALGRSRGRAGKMPPGGGPGGWPGVFGVGGGG
jgi:hypothetical protein